MISLCLLFFVLHQSSGIVYRLNATEYEKLPPLFHLDPYESCLNEDGGLYCTVDFNLVSDTPSELLTLIQEYSNHTYTHFNHTVLHHGVCVTRTCKLYLNDTITVDLNSTLEGCYNESMWNNYKLKTKISHIVSCDKKEKIYVIDAGDIAVATVIATLLMLNIVGSAYDFYLTRSDLKQGNRFLICFSIFRNWSKLVAPSGEGPEIKLRRLKSLNGIKTMTTSLVILGHSPLIYVIAVQNPLYMEEAYQSLPYHFIYNGNLIVQTFFIIAGFLLAFNIQLLAEKKKLNWTMLPMGIILRWLRLTPPYAVVLAFTSTWLRYAGSGPLWQTAVGVEVDDCRRDWWQNLLYINNYFDNTQCMAQTWYLAADMQLYCLGLIICLLLGNTTRKLVLSVLLVAGLVIPAVHIYLQDLDPIIIVSPEIARNLFVKDPTFNNIYKRGHTNLPCYIVGLAAAYIIFHLQNTDFDVQRYKKYRPLYYAIVPLEACIILLGSVFFIDGFKPHTLLRVAYSGIVRLVYGLLAFLFVSGIVFKYENLCRGILEWRGWASLGRISYCAYLLHILFIRTFSGLKFNLVQASFYEMAIQYLGLLATTFVAAVPLWMLVEAPIGQLVKVLVSPASNLNNNVTAQKLELGEKVDDTSKL